ELFGPAAVNLVGTAFLEGAREQIAQRLDHGVGQANVQVAAGCANFDLEGSDHHNFVAAADAGELGVHFRANIFGFDRVDVFPGRAITLQRDFQQAADDALFCGGEVAPLDPGAVAAVATEHAVDNQKDQIGV